VIVNVIIVVTGGLVRLTGSGLGCPTWPRCTDDSYVTTRAMGFHGVIEFGNRTLTSVVSAAALAAVVVAWLHRDRVRGILTPAVFTLVGVGIQAVIGGITVHTALNPWTVAAHFLGSMVLLAASFTLWHRSRRLGADPRPDANWAPPPAVRTLGICLTAVSAAVLVLGTLVTGSGPHAGDQKAARTGFDVAAVAQLHADAVFLLVGLSAALWFAARAVGAPARVVRAVAVLVLVELAQGAVGFVQYFTHLPIAVVILHLLGACAVWLATLNTLFAVAAAPVADPPAPADEPELLAPVS
jgi:cytochrome c oxidase assembly protein subunit 15